VQDSIADSIMFAELINIYNAIQRLLIIGYYSISFYMLYSAGERHQARARLHTGLKDVPPAPALELPEYAVCTGVPRPSSAAAPFLSYLAHYAHLHIGGVTW
jgi:hypothetical protein